MAGLSNQNVAGLSNQNVAGLCNQNVAGSSRCLDDIASAYKMMYDAGALVLSAAP
jgi:hypothetical protein